MTAEEPVLLPARAGHVLTLTLNRPAALNAINLALARALAEAVRTVEHDPDVWVVVLAGAGERAFSAGADLRERAAMTPAQVREVRATLVEAFAQLERCSRPTIAAVHGVAYGGGFELALACDLILADETARFALPEVSLGIIPGGGGTQALPRLVGRQRAKEIIFTARRIPADEAERLGIVLRRVPAGTVLAEAQALAQQIAANAPLAVRQAKRAIDLGLSLDPQSARLVEAEAYNLTLLTEDRNEGLRAFAERRPPVYRGE